MKKNNNSKIRNVLFNEISLISGVVALAIAAVMFVSKPDVEMRQNIALIQQKIQLIEENHLTTMQASIKDQADQIHDLDLKIERILTILGQ